MKFEGTEQEIMNLFAIRERAQIEALKMYQQQVGSIPTMRSAEEQAWAELTHLFPVQRRTLALPPAQYVPYQTPGHYQQPVYAEPVYQQPAPPQVNSTPIYREPIQQTVPVEATATIPLTQEQPLETQINDLFTFIARPTARRSGLNRWSLEWLKNNRSRLTTWAIVFGVVAGGMMVFNNPSIKGQLASLQTQPKASTEAVEQPPQPQEQASPSPEAETPPITEPAPPEAETQAGAEPEASMSERLDKLFPSVQ